MELNSQDVGAHRKRTRSSSSRSKEEDERPLELYPVEIWEQIFHHLSGLQLLRMRLVCRRWRDIITGCLPLMRRYRIRLQREDEENDGEDSTDAADVERQYNLTEIFPLSELVIKFYYIATVESWWPSVGFKLTYLKIEACEVEMSLLFSMLQQAPNLRVLNLKYIGLGAAEEPTFQLDKLQEFSVYLPAILYEKRFTVNLFSTIERLCPRLKALRIRRVRERHLCIDNLRRLLHSIHNTLECIELDDTRMACVLQDLQEMSRFRLKRISIHIQPSFHWGTCAKFLGSQPLLEDLVVYSKGVDHVIMSDLGRAVPKLKRLTLRTDRNTSHACFIRCHVSFSINYGPFQIMSDLGRAVPKLKRLTLRTDRNTSQNEIINTNFLQLMPNLTYLEMNVRKQKTVLPNHGNPYLRELYLKRVNIVGFMEYLEHSRQLRSITIRYCILNDETPSGAVFDNLRSLEIGHCTCVSREMLDVLLQQCPLLIELNLSANRIFDDAAVLLVCKLLKRLRKLSFVDCPITDACVEGIIRYGLSLEVFIVGKGRLSEEAVEQIRATRDIRVQFTRLWIQYIDL